MFLTAQETNIQALGVMYRVINVKHYFEELSEYNFNNQAITVKITVNDTFLPLNNNSLVVSFNNGFIESSNSANYDTEIKLDISDFSSLVMGVVTFKKSFNYGLASLTNENYLEIINTLFFSKKIPITIEQF